MVRHASNIYIYILYDMLKSQPRCKTSCSCHVLLNGCRNGGSGGILRRSDYMGGVRERAYIVYTRDITNCM